MAQPAPRPVVVATDFTQAAHRAAFLSLLDHYARDPMGGGRPLSDEVLAALVPRLAAWPTYFSRLAFCGGQAVGLINCFEGFSTFAARPLLNIHDLVVLAGFRGQGIGRLLLASAEELARSRGCCKLTLEVLEGNGTAIGAYERFGFAGYALDPATGRALFFEKKLEK